MAGKSMEQRAKVGPLLDRWKAAQSKNKVLDDRKFVELGKLLSDYDDAVEEHAGEGNADYGVAKAMLQKTQVVIKAYIHKDAQIREALQEISADVSKAIEKAEKVANPAAKLNQYTVLFGEAADRRKRVFADYVANDDAACEKLLQIADQSATIAKDGEAQRDELAKRCDKLAGQIRNLLQNYKRQIGDAKDKNAIAALDDLADLL